MLEKIVNIFNKSGKSKIEFEPAIKIKMTPHSSIIWIDKMFKVKDNYMIEVSCNNDKTNMNVAALDITYLNSLAIRLHGMYGTAKK